MFRFLILILTLIQTSIAGSLTKQWEDLRVKHSWIDIPRGWEYLSPAPGNMSFDLRLGLKQNKIKDLISSLMETSNPSHERYGKHLTKAEAEALVAPHPKSVKAVTLWLNFHKFSSEDVNYSGGWVTFRTTISQAERMLGAKYNVYHHSASSQKVIRTMGYSIPRELHHHVDIITPTTYFGTLRSMRTTNFLQPEIKPIEEENLAIDFSANASVPTSCNTAITPACLRALYKTSTYVPAATKSNKLGVVGYLDEFANRADLQKFFRQYRSEAVGSSFTTVQVNHGGDNQTNPGVEANLDIQYTTGMSFPTPNIYYSTGGSPPFDPDSDTPTNTNEPYLDWLNFILAKPIIPQVITTSYGDDEQTVPYEYANRVCNLFAQLGSLGTTVFFSSGDSGVGGGDCRTNDGTNKVLFQPVFPASCPFVTAVGGTTRVNPEIGVGFSGGGFSRYFARPLYQNQAVSKFLARWGTQHSGLYNATGRAYPDLAAQGQGFQVVIGGRVGSVGGTSASSPTVAGVFSLLNDFLLTKGKPSLGFINPLIYSSALNGFNDIVSGSNPGCNTNGFTSGKGWDPVTGLGTPDFLRLMSLV
ncbi:peptidase S8/S53 domain-containing protein [Collybia nuda]|uniref:tripeptidyl-peptidase II n=1 Tax=Collybia nuda TaxID=64659 RepID=A0A9P5XZL5_9AGAR|nr:peptidase S8/S53 domain-containing protein [Collybia nuda]